MKLYNDYSESFTRQAIAGSFPRPQQRMHDQVFDNFIGIRGSNVPVLFHWHWAHLKS